MSGWNLPIQKWYLILSKPTIDITKLNWKWNTQASKLQWSKQFQNLWSRWTHPIYLILCVEMLLTAWLERTLRDFKGRSSIFLLDQILGETQCQIVTLQLGATNNRKVRQLSTARADIEIIRIRVVGAQLADTARDNHGPN